jgi:hypothetical protein
MSARGGQADAWLAVLCMLTTLRTLRRQDDARCVCKSRQHIACKASKQCHVTLLLCAEHGFAVMLMTVVVEKPQSWCKGTRVLIVRLAVGCRWGAAVVAYVCRFTNSGWTVWRSMLGSSDRGRPTRGRCHTGKLSKGQRCQRVNYNKSRGLYSCAYHTSNAGVRGINSTSL